MTPFHVSPSATKKKKKTSITIIVCQILHLFRIDIIQMVLHELHARCKVRLVKLIRDIPAQWSKLAPFL